MKLTTRAATTVGALVCATVLVMTVAFFPPLAAAQEPGATTTALPESNEDLGRIIPLPNSGAAPQQPGDRGGWQQVTLLLAVCAVIVGMALWVWWRSRIARRERSATGHDPVTEAVAHGADVRRH